MSITKNKRGELNLGIGTLVIAAVAIIVGLVLLQASATPIAGVTQTVTFNNQTQTMAAAGSYIVLNGQAASSVIITNATGVGEIVTASNYTVTNNVVNSNGALESRLTTVAGPWAGKAINVSYISQPYGYVTDSGTRSIFPLILVFFGLAIAVVAIWAAGKTGIIDIMKG